MTPDDCGAIDPLLSPYADGMADAEEARRVEMHLPVCAACRESLSWMQATQRAVAARPVVSPPADLRARIATAIAASSAASGQARPARAFVLRPAFAAAASLTALGVAVSYGLFHTQALPTAKNGPAVAPKVAVAPPVNPLASVVKTATGPGVKPPVAHHPAAAPKRARFNPDLVARAPLDESPSEPVVVRVPAGAGAGAKTPAKPAPALALIKPHPSFVKKPILPHFKPELLATTKTPASPAETHKPPALQPEIRKPETFVAKLPPAPAHAAPTFVEKPPVITPDPAPTVAVASSHEGHFQTADFLGPVRQHLGQMRNVAYSTGGRTVNKGIASTAHGPGSEGMAYVPGVYTP